MILHAAGANVRVARPDDWLLSILGRILSPESMAAITDSSDGLIWTAVVRLGFLSDEELLSAVAARSHAETAGHLTPTADARNEITLDLARKFQILPLRVGPSFIEIATSNPYDMDCERTLAFVTGRSVRILLAPPMTIARRIEEVYGERQRLKQAETQRLKRAETQSRRFNNEAAGEPVIRLVDRIVSKGIAERASDIHLEPEERGVAVRFRVDGLLRHVMLLPKAVGNPLVSRIKIMARLDIADRLRPQGGHASVGTGSERVDLRVSTLPASHGEKVVIRILDPRSAIRSLESLGLDAIDAPRMQKLLEVREGLVLVTGPTGSGKTTTLYAALTHIQQRGLNVITVEDPVEYRIPGVVQVQINEKAGLTFAAALRSILRQDPDVVLIGEIRDRETAAIAIQASLTGHLVFATLHTNDACSSITRLVDLGVDSAKLAAALKGVVAQRLIRKLCIDCRIVANGGVATQLRESVAGDVMVNTAVGCEGCAMTGYRGRLAVTEIVLADNDLERAIVANASVDALSQVARRNGSRSLWDSGVAHLVCGTTSGDELLRVLEQQPQSVHESASSSTNELWDFFETPATTPAAYDSRRDAASESRDDMTPDAAVTRVVPGVVDVYVIRPLPGGWRVLAVQRAHDTRCPGAWETVHGRLEAGERPEEAAVREVREECGLDVLRLYNVTVQPFYLHILGTVQLAIVFAAFVDEPATVALGEEHQRYEWLAVDDALGRFVWPREREALRQIVQLLSAGDAGAVEDVLRVY
ncbi:MAG: Flp pilus assembly complex ATPase component TadA [Gemmatimonadaceae bacterium]|nr:Flp pilus assembly complex ATPase component TadA [Gemmatimonadaceae bacterium]